MKNKSKASRKHTNTRTEDSGSFSNNFRFCGIGVIISLLSLISLTFILSIIALLYNDPNKLVFPLSVIALCISSAIGGFFSARRSSFSPFIAGLLTGAVLLVVYLFLSFIFKSPRDSSFIHILSFRISVPVMSIAGAYLSLKHKGRKPHGKRK